MATGHEKISPTAWATAHARTFTDIPYSKEIFKLLEKKRESLGQTELSTKMKEPSLTIIMESRYKMADKVLAEMGARQILEVASGLVQRGLIMTADPRITYVELDLPGIMSEKKEMIGTLLKGGLRPNLLFEPGDALDLEDMTRAARHFDRSRPLFILNEGLLRYLTFKEKETFAENVKVLLREFGGYWITPDVSNKRTTASKDSQSRRAFNKQVEKSTGMNIEANLFESKQHAVEFFRGLGFDVEQRSYAEVADSLVCPKILGIPQEDIDDLAKNAVLLVMSVKRSI